MNMDPIEKERDGNQWLESALRQYGKAEPRAGLESRLLANLLTERNRIASRRRWWWALGTATALAAVVAAVWVGESGRERNPESAAGTSTTIHREPGLAPHAAHPAREVARRRPANRPLRDLSVSKTPKLAQFPSPQPLSEQEQILVSYVAKYPESAALVAEARAEALRRDREEEADAAASGSIR